MYKIILTILLSSVIVFSFIGNFDLFVEEEIDSSFKKALTIFATAKGLNAAISVAQGTQIGPIAIGEILDPVNDVIEQFSWVMLAALTSLGIQKILTNITADMVFNIVIATVIGFFILMIWFKEKIDKRCFNAAVRVVLILLFIRFAVPAISYVNQIVYENYISKTEFNIDKNNENLDISAKKIEQITIKDPDSSWLSMIKNFNFSQKVEYFKKEAVHISDYVINLIIVYIFQTIFFPLIFLLTLYTLIKNSLTL